MKRLRFNSNIYWTIAILLYINFVALFSLYSHNVSLTKQLQSVEQKNSLLELSNERLKIDNINYKEDRNIYIEALLNKGGK